MADDLPVHEDGEFTTVPAPLAPKTTETGLTAEIAALEQAGPPFPARAAGFDVRKKSSPVSGARRWLLGASVPVGLAAVSWLLGGGVIWAVLATLAVLGLIVFVFAGLRGKQPEDLRLHHFLVFGFLLLCWGAWTAPGYFLPLTTIQVEGDVLDKMEHEPDCPFRVSYGGRVLVEGERARKSAVQFRGRFQPEKLKIQTLTAHGWVDRWFRADSDSVNLEKLPTALIYVDNRGHKEVLLGCGRLSFVKAAGSKEAIRVPTLPEDAHCPLTLDGKEVGVLEGGNVLVDTSGVRSYQFRTITYGGALDLMLNAGRVPGQHLPQAERFRQGHVHHLPCEINFFLEAAPEKITVTTFGSLGALTEQHTRTELTEMEP